MVTYDSKEDKKQDDDRDGAPEASEEKKAYIQALCARFERVQSDRSVWENHWQETFKYIIPRKGAVTTTHVAGDKYGNELFDTTAIAANQLLAGALHGRLTNPAAQFFEYTTNDPELDEQDDVREWLQVATHRTHVILNNSNFQTETHEVYLDLGSIGTSCMYIAENDENYVHFSARYMKEIFVEENNLGRVDTVYRLFQWDLRQIVQEFGEDVLPAEYYRKYEKGDMEKYSILHVVMPQDDEGKKKYFAYKSCYILLECKHQLSEGGFEEFPYAVPRWTKTTGEVYGRGPGTEMLPDIKMVNEMMKAVLQGAQKAVNPPLMVSDDGVIGNIRLTPSGLTVVRDIERIPVRPLITDTRIDFGYQAVDDVRKRIRTGFYVDQLQLKEGPQMTATEVMQRAEDTLSLMGPVMGRQHHEYLSPLITRVFRICYRKGVFPKIPEALQGRNISVKYSSLVAKAQRASEGVAFTRAIQQVAPILQMAPQSMDIIDPDAAIRYLLTDVYGLPYKLLRDKGEIKKIRVAKAEQAAQMQAQQQQMQQAEMASKVLPAAAQVMG